MAITIANLTGDIDAVDRNAYTVASTTTTGNRLALLSTLNTKATTPDTPTITDSSRTWTQLATVTFDTIASSTADGGCRLTAQFYNDKEL